MGKESRGERAEPDRRPRVAESSPRLSKKQNGKWPARPAGDDESDSDIGLRLEGRNTPSGPDVPIVTGSFNHSMIAGNVGISKDRNDVGVNVAVGLGVRWSAASSPSPKYAGGPAKRISASAAIGKNKNLPLPGVDTPSTLLPFDEFPLLTLSVGVFHTTSLITAETFTTWRRLRR